MSTATIECGGPDRYAGNWTASLRISRTGWIFDCRIRPEYGIAGKSLHIYFKPSVYSLSQGRHESCFYSTNPGVVRIRIRKHHSTSSRDGALMQETGQQIRANAHTCAGCGTLYTIWHMYWWRLLLELRLPLLSTAYSVSGSPGLVLGAVALLWPSF
jgi:hypothetical protein